MPYRLVLPPDAQLPRLLGILNDLCDLLDKALAPVTRFRRVRNDLNNDIKLAVGVHALNALDAARAVYTLSSTDHAGTIFPHFRTVFEALVKIKWMRAQPARARDYLDSEPFERYIMATARVKQSDRWQQIVNDCKTTVAQNPRLLTLPGATKGAKGRPNFAAIGKALRMPDLSEMAKAIGMDEDDYLIDFDVPSLTPHTSVMHTKSFAQALNGDGSVTLSTKPNPLMLQGYVARTATRLGGIVWETLQLFPDGALQYKAELILERLKEAVIAIKGVMPS